MIRPPKNLELTKTLIKDLYNYDVISIKELNGYDDRNFYIKTIDSKEFIFKISNSVESEETGLLEAFNKVILHLYNNGLKVTVPQVNTRGTYLSFHRIPATNEDSKVNPSEDNPLFGVRLLDFIPGKVLVNVPFTPGLLRECGEFLAKLTKALETFESSVLSNRIPLWSLLNVSNIRQYLDAVDDSLHRSIVTHTLDEFESKVMSRLDQLEYGFIHGDFNEQNIIVDFSPSCAQTQTLAQEEYHVKGVIDFSDVQYAPVVFDLAIFLCYSMLEFKAGPQILAPGFGLNGYMRFRKLNENELNVLNVCIKARLCQSLVMGAHSYRMDPSNEYLICTQKNGWPALRALHNCDSNDILNKWLQIDKTFSEL